MADPALLTAVIGTAAGALGAGAAMLANKREKARDRDARAEAEAETSVSSWTALNAALNREISRLHDEMDRLRGDYEKQLESARRRITELETDLAALHRMFGKPGP